MLGYIFTTVLTFLLAVSFVPIVASAHTDDEETIVDTFTCEVEENESVEDAEAYWWWCYDESDYDALHGTKNGAFSLSLRVDIFDNESGDLIVACSGETSTKSVDTLEGAYDERLEQACTQDGCDDEVRACHVEDVDVEEVFCPDGDLECLATNHDNCQAVIEADNVEIVYTGDVKATHVGNVGGPSGNASSDGQGGGLRHHKAIFEGCPEFEG